MSLLNADSAGSSEQQGSDSIPPRQSPLSRQPSPPADISSSGSSSDDDGRDEGRDGVLVDSGNGKMSYYFYIKHII